MYAQVVQHRLYHLLPKPLALMRRKTDQEIAQRMATLPGFQAYYLVQVGEGRAFAISFWDTRAEAEAGGKQLLAWVKENPVGILTSEMSLGEVVIVQRRPEEAAGAPDG